VAQQLLGEQPNLERQQLTTRRRATCAAQEGRDV